MSFQVNFGPAGPVPTPPATLRAMLLSAVAAVRPGYTATLPGSLIEDISSTSVGALAIVDQAAVDLVASVGATTANPYLLKLLGQMLGVPVGEASNTSVRLVFTGTPGFVLGKGFTVSDTDFQYALVDGGIIGSDGQTNPLFAVATQSGSWAVPAGTVTEIVTSVPSPYAVTVVNPLPGIPGTDSETEASYRARVLQAGLVAAQGYYAMLDTLLANVPGVQRRLTNAISQPGGGWEVLAGGGDPYKMAYAIYQSTQDISTLVGSTINIAGITNANPGVVSTDITHGYVVGQTIEISETTPVDYDDTYAVLAVPDANSFALGTAFPQNQLTAQSWSAGQITFTTTTNHGVTEGSTFVIAGSTPSGYSGTFVADSGTTADTLICTTTDPGSSTVLGHLVAGIANVDTTSTTPWVSGGVVTPNFRNQNITIIDYPNTYVIPFAVPPPQVVTMTVTWDTTSANFISEAAVAQAAAPALADYINSLQQASPINELEMNAVFRRATASILPPSQISRLTYSVAIDGVGVSPEMGTDLIFGDSQSFLSAAATGISVVQG